MITALRTADRASERVAISTSPCELRAAAFCPSTVCDLSDSDKYALMQRRIPEGTFKFPGTVYKDSRCPNGTLRRCSRHCMARRISISYVFCRGGRDLLPKLQILSS